jgi:hypothetical protein
MPYPLYRPRRLRESPLLRKMVRETMLKADDFMLPLFTVHGRGVREPIGSMPGQYRLSIDELLKECKDAASMGIPAVLLFGLPQTRTRAAARAYAEDGIIQQAVAGGEGHHPRSPRGHRRVPLRVHQPRALRRWWRTAAVKNDPTLDLSSRAPRSPTPRRAPTWWRPRT